MVLIGSAPQDSVSFGVAAGFPQGRIINVYQLQDNASMLKGQHTIKFGAEVDQQRSPNVYLPGNNGVFVFTSFSDVIANNPVRNSDRVGQSDPSLLGVGSGSLCPGRLENQEQFHAESWHAMGLVSAGDQPAARSKREATNGCESAVVDILPLSQTTVPSIPEALKNFAPVVGFAWTPQILNGLLGVDKTVIRGGFRIAYDPAFYNMFLNVATAAPR